MKKFYANTFSYPLDFDYEYVFPTRYYLNAQTGRSIIKKSQIKLQKPVGIDKDGIVELPDEDDETKDEENEDEFR